MKPEFIVLTLILLGALYLFWTQRLRTDIAALLVMLSMALPWPRPDGKWSAILSPQEAFSGFGSVAVIMVTAMFVFSAAMVRTGAAEMIGGRLFRVCAHNELLLQIAVLFVAAAFSMFINETTIVLIFMPVVLGVCKERNLSPSRYLLCAAYGAALGGQWTLIGTRSNIIVSDLLRLELTSLISRRLPPPFSLAVRLIFFCSGGGFCRKPRCNRWSRNWARSI